jgi:predicted metal-binding membrane protein
MTSVHARRQPLPRPTILLVIGVAWTLAVVAEVTGGHKALHHGPLIGSGLPVWTAIIVFLVAWQVMIAAMMLPSSLPLVTLFFRAASSQPGALQAKAAFLAGYGAIWSTFGALAFGGDVALHRAVEGWPWVDRRPWLLGGVVVILAGAFQFSELKHRCLKVCRHPGVYLLRHYGRGTGRAFRIGAGHALFCLGCCWALMLVSFAVGVANLPWMALLTAIMVFEKTGRDGERGVAPIGMAFLALGALVILNPSWMPALYPHP